MCNEQLNTEPEVEAVGEDPNAFERFLSELMGGPPAWATTAVDIIGETIAHGDETGAQFGVTMVEDADTGEEIAALIVSFKGEDTIVGQVHKADRKYRHDGLNLRDNQDGGPRVPTELEVTEQAA